MSTLYAELFTRLSVHPVVWMVLALFSSTAAFKAFCEINASVQLLRIAFLPEIFSVYGLSTHLHVIARNVILLLSTVFFFVFATCGIAWLRDRDLPEIQQEPTKPGSEPGRLRHVWVRGGRGA
jgi:hypothetical protein